MAKIESVIKSEIQRLAKKEIRSSIGPLRNEVRGMKPKLSILIKRFTILDRLVRDQLRQTEKQKSKLEATPEEVKASRLSPGRIQGLRKKLGISQRELGILTGASLGTVLAWEKGKYKPKPDKKAALVALRKLGKRDVKKLLEKENEPKAVGKKPGANPKGKKPAQKRINKLQL